MCLRKSATFVALVTCNATKVGKRIMCSKIRAIMNKPALVLFLLAVLSGLTSFNMPGKPEYGKASVYSDKMQGRPTSSGERYDKNQLTCAHKTHTFGTRLRVTRVDNGKYVEVRVNDRGPFLDGYVVDLSRRAAEAIGLVREGQTRVKIEVIGSGGTPKVGTEQNRKALPSAPEPVREPVRQSEAPGSKGYSSRGREQYEDPYDNRIPETARQEDITSELFEISTSQPPKSGYCIQVGAFADASNVLPLVKKLQNDFPGNPLVYSVKDNVARTSVSKVLIGPFDERKDAVSMQKAALKKGYKTIVVNLEDF